MENSNLLVQTMKCMFYFRIYSVTLKTVEKSVLWVFPANREKRLGMGRG
jgi:hypothetical protein